MSGRGPGRENKVSGWKLSYAMKALRLHRETTAKCVAARLGVSVFTLRNTLYDIEKNQRGDVPASSRSARGPSFSTTGAR